MTILAKKHCQVRESLCVSVSVSMSVCLSGESSGLAIALSHNQQHTRVFRSKVVQNMLLVSLQKRALHRLAEASIEKCVFHDQICTTNPLFFDTICAAKHQA